MSRDSGRVKDMTSKQLFWPGTGYGHEYLLMISVMVTSWFCMVFLTNRVIQPVELSFCGLLEGSVGE